MNEDRVDFHLWNWSRWMGAGLSNHLKDRSCASGGMGKSGSSDFDDMVSAADKRCAEATDACIDGLPTDDKRAIYAIHLGGKWGLPAIALPLYYRAACTAIGKRLDRHGIV